MKKLIVCGLFVSLLLILVFIIGVVSSDDAEDALIAYSYLIGGGLLLGIIFGFFVLNSWALAITGLNVALAGMSGYLWIKLFCFELPGVQGQGFLFLNLSSVVLLVCVALLALVYHAHEGIKGIAPPLIALLIQFMFLTMVLATLFFLILGAKITVPIENTSADQIFWVRFFIPLDCF